MTQQNGTNAAKCAEEYTVKRGDSFYLIAHKLGVPLRDLLAANRDIHPARLMVGDVLCIPREEDDSPSSGGLGATGSGTSSGGTAQTAPGGGTTSDTAGAAPGGTAGTASPTTDTGSGAAAETIPAPAESDTAPGNAAGTAPSGGTASGTTGTTAENNTPGAPSGSAACPTGEAWVVQQGQTVSDLQLRGLVSRHTLETANPGVDLDALGVGQTVCIPKDNVPCALPETYTLAAGETLEGVAVRFNLPVASLLRCNPCMAPQDFEPGVTVVLPR